MVGLLFYLIREQLTGVHNVFVSLEDEVQQLSPNEIDN